MAVTVNHAPNFLSLNEFAKTSGIIDIAGIIPSSPLRHSLSVKELN